jgi:hypothetical protein
MCDPIEPKRNAGPTQESVRIYPQRTSTVLLVVLFLIASVRATGAQGAEIVRPLAWKTLSTNGHVEYSGFSAVGVIFEIDHANSTISVISYKPFWAPQPGIWGRIALWPAKVILKVQVAAMAPITLDGKRVGFNELAVGQTASVQYSIYGATELHSVVYCAARRIEGRTTAPAKTR